MDTASVSSMWEPDEDLQTGMVEALFDPVNPQTSVGACLNAGKMVVSSSNQSYHEMYNLMGDPALEMFPVDSEPYIHVLSPDGLEEWERNGAAQILWNDNIDGMVKIELLKNSSVVNTIASSTPSDGVYEWKTPLDVPTGADFKIRISSVDSMQLIDTSNSNFNIIEEYIIKNFPYVENFDALDTPTVILPRNWEQISEDDFDWIVFAGPTPSRAGVPSNITGAIGDHTTDTGNYIYVEASDANYPNKKTDFLTCKFNFKALTHPALIFWSHMFSDTNTMGDLHLDVNVDGTWHTDIALLSGDHGDRWFARNVNLSPYPVNLQSGKVFFLFDPSGCSGGELKILDALGNRIAEKRFEGAVKSLTWDLKNNKGAKVSGGAYLAVLILDYKDGSTRLFRKYVGIKEE